eukprot:959558_1
MLYRSSVVYISRKKNRILNEAHLKDKETYFQIQFITWLFGMNGTKDVNNIGIFTRDFSKKYDTELQEMRIRQQKLLIEFSNKLLGLDTDDPIAIEQHIVDALSLNPYLMINDEDFLADPIPNCDELHPMVAPHARIDPCEDIMAISTQNCDTLITPSALHSHTVGTETQDDPSTSESAPNVSISAIPQQQQIQMWCCPNCTFEQEDYLDKCEVCGELNVIDVSRDNPLPSPTAAIQSPQSQQLYDEFCNQLNDDAQTEDEDESLIMEQLSAWASSIQTLTNTPKKDK